MARSSSAAAVRKLCVWLHMAVGVCASLVAAPATLAQLPLHQPEAALAEPSLYPEMMTPDAAGAGANADTASAETQLLRLVLQEQALLENYGADHPQVISLRARMATLRAYVDEHRVLRQAAERQARATRAEAVSVAPQDPAIIPAAFEKANGPKPPSDPPLPMPLPDRVEPTSVREVQAKAPQPTPIASPRTVASVADDGETPGSFRGVARQWGLVLLSAMLPGLMLQVAALVFILRRWSARPSGTFRVELINPSASALPAAALPNVSPVPAAQHARQPVRTGRAQMAKETNRTPAASPIFRQMVEENLRLRAGIAELECSAP